MGKILCLDIFTEALLSVRVLLVAVFFVEQGKDLEKGEVLLSRFLVSKSM